MLSSQPSSEIDYPETDGKPMGETDWHIDALIRLRDILQRRYHGQNVYVGSDLLVYYEMGQPHRFVVPDVFVALNCPPGPRRVFKTWEEGCVPSVVFEITSRSTAREDVVFKPTIYHRLGVQELFLFDPTSEFMNPPLKGFRLEGDQSEPIESSEGRIVSRVLGVTLHLQGDKLRMSDTESGRELQTTADAERAARLAADAERTARIAAEAEADRLRAELERVKRQLGQS